ncbi:MAG: hypothetical protein Q4A86_05870 [Clostridia bacterium]|nr:hypothetical protein [Clostridia bacterium]
MAFKIGFSAETEKSSESTVSSPVYKIKTPKKSVVRIHFPTRNMTLSYYNDQFDLRIGDLVYVDGKLEGLQGRVVEVSYNFKIKLSEYKRVIALVDTDVCGDFFMAGSHFINFDRNSLPYEKAILWFRAPIKEDDVFVSGSDEQSFMLSDLTGMKIGPEIAERGHGYYVQNKVRYISLDGHKGHAIVEGSEAYEIDFDYYNGEISNLTCSCFCTYRCKHEFAAMLQLRETLDYIENNYSAEFHKTDYFSAIAKHVFFSIAIDSKEIGKITI